MDAPFGRSIVTTALNGKLVLWTEEEPKKVHTLTIDSHSIDAEKITGKWNTLDATGDIHPGIANPAHLVHDQTIFICGGSDGSTLTNALTTLSSSGHFTRLHPTGEIPSPRMGHCGFTHNDGIYFFGGMVKEPDDSRREDFIEKDDKWWSTELFWYDADSNCSSYIVTTGARPLPKGHLAIAKIDDGVLIHGGEGRYWHDCSFSLLNMNTHQWTRINQYSTRFLLLSMERLSSNQVFCLSLEEVLERAESGVYNQLQIFRADSSSWIPMGKIIRDFAPKYPFHVATAQVAKQNGTVVFCFADGEPRRIFVLDLTYKDGLPRSHQTE